MFVLPVTDHVSVCTYVFSHILTNKHVHLLSNAETSNPNIPGHHNTQRHMSSHMTSLKHCAYAHAHTQASSVTPHGQAVAHKLGNKCLEHVSE